MHIHIYFKMPTVEISKAILATAFFAIALSACGKTETRVFTADRLKMVEEKQKADAELQLQKKSGATASNEPAATFPETLQAAPPKALAKM